MTDVRDAFRFQAGFCDRSGAPVTARVCTGLVAALSTDSETGRRVLDWPREPIADAVALRLVGGLHALHRAGVDPDLSAVFGGRTIEPSAVARTLAATLVAHDAALLPWLDGPPQTNEAARSAALMTGLLHLAARFGARFELLEIGSSAGLNLLIDRYRFDLGGVGTGPAGSPVTLAPRWEGPPPPDAPVDIVSIRGVDIRPIDLADPAAAARLAAYVWIDTPERAERLARATAMVRAHGVDLMQGDAADWVEARLAEPQAAGVTRVLMHSVVWQYLPPATQARIGDAMARAGADATSDRPLGWVTMEPDGDMARHAVRVRAWPGGTDHVVARAHPHGAWIDATPAP